jgi:phosphatidylglycerophosphate synthase
VFRRELIEELRTRGYRPRAWLTYAWEHLQLVRRVIEERPAPVRSIIGHGALLFVLLFVFSLVLALLGEGDVGRRVFLAGASGLVLLCLWLLFHLGLLSDLSGRPLLHLGAPNALTLFRGATIAPVVILAADGQIALAGVLYAAAALSDVADGIVARRRGPLTRLGVIMDALVDIAWNAGAVLALQRAGILPWWMLALVAVRYGLLLVGSAVLYLRNTALRVRPTRFGKASGTAITGALLLVMVNRVMVEWRVQPEWWRAGEVGALLELVLAFLPFGTIAYVIVLGALNYRSPDLAREPVGRVVGGIRQ